MSASAPQFVRDALAPQRPRSRAEVREGEREREGGREGEREREGEGGRLHQLVRDASAPSAAGFLQRKATGASRWTA